MSSDYRVRLVDGTLFDPWNPSEPIPSFTTAATGMSRICRYGGHVTRHYSVLEHTLWVTVKVLSVDETQAADMALALVSRSPRWPRLVRVAAERPGAAVAGLTGLVHDSPEGLGLVDMLRPVKNRLEMASYRDADSRLLEIVCQTWGVPSPQGGPDVWSAAWNADSTVYAAENAIRPSGPGVGLCEFVSDGWTWLDLKEAHVLDDAGETTAPGARQWLVRAACQAWDELMKQVVK